ncbi:MAG TPA: hypothetical protein VML00_04355, partial [Bacteroidota bacterium]|nr:hypothetical protein [Bacteroidota bacterium]
LRPDGGGGWILHLYNAGSAPAEARVTWRGPGAVEFTRCGLGDEPGTACTFPLLMPPSGTAFLRIR